MMRAEPVPDVSAASPSRETCSVRITAPLLKRDLPLAAVLAALIALGLGLRLHQLSFPETLKWDEHHYVDTARSYLQHRYAWNDHPPLSKLIIAASMAVLGDRPLAWRLPSLLFGVANVALIGALARVVFQSRRAGVLAAALVAADGFFIAYSRVALLDGMIVAFATAAVLILLQARSVWHVIGAGICVGCAVSFKLNGLVFVALATAMCLASPALRRYTPLLLTVAVGVFYLQCAYALARTGRSASILAVVEENRAMVRSHLSYTVVHPMSSHWYTWFLPVRPIFLRHDVEIDGSVRALLALGNPLLWWSSTAAVVAAAAALFRQRSQRLRESIRLPIASPTPSTKGPINPGALLWLLAAWAGPVVFWIPSLRDAYLYHDLPSYAFALVLLAGLIERVYRARRLLALCFVLLVAETTIVYAPLSAELPISRGALDARLFEFWR
jgi:dolichyl-phosphate-mannose-protein mannosyltransferase